VIVIPFIDGRSRSRVMVGLEVPVHDLVVVTIVAAGVDVLRGQHAERQHPN
jgi:hypothetical protein